MDRKVYILPQARPATQPSGLSVSQFKDWISNVPGPKKQQVSHYPKPYPTTQSEHAVRAPNPLQVWPVDQGSKLPLTSQPRAGSCCAVSSSSCPTQPPNQSNVPDLTPTSLPCKVRSNNRWKTGVYEIQDRTELEIQDIQYKRTFKKSKSEKRREREGRGPGGMEGHLPKQG